MTFSKTRQEDKKQTITQEANGLASALIKGDQQVLKLEVRALSQNNEANERLL